MMTMGFLKHDDEWSFIVEMQVFNLLYALFFEADV